MVFPPWQGQLLQPNDTSPRTPHWHQIPTSHSSWAKKIQSLLTLPPSPNPIQHHHQLWEGDWHQFLKGNRSSCTSNLKWPRQIRPSQQCWTILRRTLHLLFTKLPKSNQLNQGHYLYHWLSHSLSHQQLPTFINSSTLLIYSRHPGSPSTYSIYIPRHRFSHTSSGTSTPLLPTISVPITVFSWTPLLFQHFSTRNKHLQLLPLLPKYIPQQPSPTHRASTLNTQTRQCHHPLLISLQNY